MSGVAIAVLVSGGGTNLQALLDAQQRGEIDPGRIELVVSSSRGAHAMKRAENSGVEVIALECSNYESPGDYDARMLEILRSHDIDMVILAGFLRIVGPKVLAAYKNRIINIHPSLIPSFCGPGLYGLRVHEAALEAGVKVTGATVHYVSDVVDGGRIMLQKAVDVKDGDTPETLQQRVLEEAEWVILPRAAKILADKIHDEKEKA